MCPGAAAAQGVCHTETNLFSSSESPGKEARLVVSIEGWALWTTGSSAAGLDGAELRREGVGDPWLTLSPRTLHRSLQLSRMLPEKWPEKIYNLTASPKKPETQVRRKRPHSTCTGAGTVPASRE